MLAFLHFQYQVDGSLTGIARRPGLSRHRVRRVSVCPQALPINPSL